MAPSAAGAIVTVSFPFSDLSRAKLRPAVVLAGAGRTDWVLCQITSNPYADALAVQLTNSSFSAGGLQITSYARSGKLFTASESLITSEVGTLKPDMFEQVLAAVIALLRPPVQPTSPITS